MTYYGARADGMKPATIGPAFRPGPSNRRHFRRNPPIDRFVRARLAQEGIEPSPAAERASSFAESRSTSSVCRRHRSKSMRFSYSQPDAFERVVDRLLASEHFGERSWARWWLDLAHYADSDGRPAGFVRPTASHYRQWVVDALNRDLPFDRFTIEQLAGDLLPDATTQQRIATGFLPQYAQQPRRRHRPGRVPASGRRSIVPPPSATTWLRAHGQLRQECHEP